MNVIIYGASGQGRVTLDLLSQLKKLKVVGFIDDRPELVGTQIDGVRVLGTGETLSILKKKKVRGAVLAIGVGAAREVVSERVRKAGLEVVGFVHPKAMVSKKAAIHPTAMVWPAVVVNAGAVVGESTILNSAAVVEHDVVVGRFVHVAPNATICGSSSVGDRTWVGASAVVIQEVDVGSDVMIGAGAVVVKRIPDGTKGSGIPFRSHD